MYPTGQHRPSPQRSLKLYKLKFVPFSNFLSLTVLICAALVLTQCANETPEASNPTAVVETAQQPDPTTTVQPAQPTPTAESKLTSDPTATPFATIRSAAPRPTIHPPDNLEQDFADLGIAVHTLALSRLAGVVFGRSRLVTALEQLQPDVLHSQGLRADWLSSRLSKSYIKIATQRNNPLQDYPSLMGQLKGTVAARLHYRALARLPVVVACSQTIADANTLRGLSTSVIHNGVDLNLTKAPMNHEGRTAPRHALGLPEAGRLFLYAGPLIPRKNPELLEPGNIYTI